MGRFFNEVLMKMHKIPLNQTQRSPLEQMRRDFNKENKSPELSLEEKRKINLAKAREAKKRKKEANA